LKAYVILLLTFLGTDQLVAQQTLFLKRAVLPDHDLTLHYKEIAESTGYPGLRRISSIYQQEGAQQVWLTAEKALASFDGVRMSTYFPAYRSPEKLRPQEIFPVSDTRFIISYAKLPNTTLKVIAADLFDTETCTFSPLDFPSSPDQGSWLMQQSGYGLYLIHSSGNTYYYSQRARNWVPDMMFGQASEDVLSAGRYSAGWISYLGDTKKVMWINDHNAGILLEGASPVRNHLSGQYNPYHYLVADAGKGTQLVSIDPATGEMNRQTICNCTINNTEAYFTPATREVWLYDKDTGMLNAYRQGASTRVRSIPVGDYIGSRGITALAVVGQHIFIATDGAKLFWLDSKPIALTNQATELGSIRSFFARGDTLLIGSYTGNYAAQYAMGKGFLQPERVTLGYDKVNARPTAMSFCADTGNTLWVGLESKVIKSQWGDFRQGKVMSAGLKTGDIWVMRPEGDYLLIGADNGFFAMHKRSGIWSQLRLSGKHEEESRVYGMFRAQDGAWVVYGDGGIRKVWLSAGKITRKTTLLTTPVLYVYPESEASWWVGTLNGLLCINPTSGEHKYRDQLTFFQQLEVYAIYPDRQQRLWISSSDGIFVMNENQESLYRFSKDQGLTESEFNRNAHWQFPDGRMVFGTISGFVTVNPAVVDIPAVSEASDAVFMADEQHILMIQQDGLLELPADIRQLRIAYRGLSAVSNDSRYAYRIAGRHDDWITGRGPGIIVSELPRGKHTLEIYRETDGHWISMPPVTFRKKVGVYRIPGPLRYVLFFSMVLLPVFYLRKDFVRAYSRNVSPLRGMETPKPELLAERRPMPVLTVTAPSELSEQDKSAGTILNLVNQVLDTNYANPDLNIATFANQLAMSERRLYDLIKKHTGKTPSAYILEFRLVKAYQAILSNPLKPVIDILYESGFNTPSYFTKRFSERFGISPSDLQKITLHGEEA
jgi:AraC-like DNA-binding protein